MNANDSICQACGASGANKKCGKCLHASYCNRECQKSHWKVHKKVCSGGSDKKSSSQEAAVRVPSAAAVVEFPCRKCRINPDDLEAAAMCMACGTFILCGFCAMRPENNAENGCPKHVVLLCTDCLNEYPDPQVKVGSCLQNLLHSKPTGRHVCYAQLMLAQLQLQDTEEFSGIPVDKSKAKQEYFRLADEENYALAQFAVATFYDPTDDMLFWDGPLRLQYMLDTPLRRPFRADGQKAKQYYQMAVENKCIMAIQTVGTMHKNGDLFRQNKTTAFVMLQEAANAGDPRAMCNLGQMLMRGDGVPRDDRAGFNYYQRAAQEYDIWSAQFMIAQLGFHSPQYFQQGKRWAHKLAQNDWAPPNPMHDGVWAKLRLFYGID